MFPSRCLAKQIYCEKCLRFHWVCNFQIMDYHSIIATLKTKWHSGKDPAKIIRWFTRRSRLRGPICQSAPHPELWVSPRRPTVPFTAETPGTDDQNICMRLPYNGGLRHCAIYTTSCSVLTGGPPKQVSEQPKLRLVRQQGIIPTPLCIEVSPWVCVKD